MPTRRIAHVWSPGTGWIKRKTTQERDYSGFDDAWWAFLIWVWRWWPDKLLDILRSQTANFANLEFTQRVMLRTYARYCDVSYTGTRGVTKTYSKLCYAMINGLLWPGTQSAYYGPSYKQMAAIGAKTYKQVENDYPMLAKHWRVTAQSKDDFKIETDAGSSFYISAMRGDNLHDVTAEEFAQEEPPPFDFNEYTTIVLPAVRLTHNVGGHPDENYVAMKAHTITSAGRKQNPAYGVRREAMKAMQNGESAFCYDISWETVILQQMRPYSWAQKLKNKLSPEKWMREMESRYTGADEFPVLSDETLAESQCLMSMEREHICKYPGSGVDPKDVTYIVCYDVSYEDSKKNAKCACGVLKLTRQKEFLKRDRYLKQLVYLDDWPPPDNGIVQARKLKDIWGRFCFPGGNPTYIAIDGWQYGKSVVEDLMKDLGDGQPPLCVRNHAAYTSLELPGALPVIYPIKAAGPGSADPDFEMLKYAQSQFDNHNVQLLTMYLRDGVENYKKLHGIRDDATDYRIAVPYQKTRELVAQIQNLKLVPSGAGMSEKRISRAIQRDSWSAVKYGLRLAQILEREELIASIHQKGDWGEVLDQYRDARAAKSVRAAHGRLATRRMGGRIN